MPLHWLLELLWELFIYFEFNGESGTRVELSHTNLADCAVTDEVTEAVNVRYHRLEVRLAEHEGHKFADGCKQHHHVACTLHLIKTFLRSELLRHILSNV